MTVLDKVLWHLCKKLNWKLSQRTTTMQTCGVISEHSSSETLMKVGVVEVFSTVALIRDTINQSNQYELNITFARNSNWWEANQLAIENDIFFSVSDTGILGKRNSEFSQQESNLRPSDY